MTNRHKNDIKIKSNLLLKLFCSYFLVQTKQLKKLPMALYKINFPALQVHGLFMRDYCLRGNDVRRKNMCILLISHESLILHIYANLLLVPIR